MDTNSVNAKTRGLLEPVLGPQRTEVVIQRVNELESVGNVNEILPFLTISTQEMASVSPAH